MPDVLMPRLSDSMEEGTLLAWLVADGETVERGQEVVEIESDKATISYAVEAAGVLEILAAEGETLLVGAPIGRVRVAGKTTPPRRRATPIARRMAGVHGLDLHGIAASGARGLVIRADVEAALDEASDGSAVAAPVEAIALESCVVAVELPLGDGSGGAPDRHAPTVREPSRIERLVAQRMVQSRTEIPEFSVAIDIDMAAALAMRAELRAVVSADADHHVPSVNDLVVKAVARTLVEHPRVNRAWRDDQIVEFGSIDVGIAVATDEGGLVVPVVRGADRLGLGTLVARTRELTERARAGRSTPADLAGGGFTVSNLGMFGVASFTAVITPGQGAILSVGAASTRAVEVDGAVAWRPVLTATLTSDHRVIYGAPAAAFLARLRTLLEHPAGLAL